MEFSKITQRTHSISAKKLSQYPYFLSRYLQVKLACTLANEKSGHVTKKKARLIRAAIVELIKENKFKLFYVDPYSGGGGIALSTNMNEAIQKVVYKRSGVLLDRKLDINASQSTADTCATAFRLSLRDRVDDIQQKMIETVDILQKKSNEFKNIKITARTCLQPAGPSTLGRLFKGYIGLYQRKITECDKLKKSLLEVNLGGTVFGQSDNASKEYRALIIEELRAATKLEVKKSKNFFDRAQNIDDLENIGNFINTLGSTSIKFSKDLRLLSMEKESSLGVLQLYPVIPGSSFYSDKVNPTIVETFIQSCFLAKSLTQYSELATQHGELQLNTFEAGSYFSLVDALNYLSNGFKILNLHALSTMTLKK